MRWRRCLCLSMLAVLFLRGEASWAGVRLLPPPSGVYHAAHPDYGLRDDLVTRDRIDAFRDLAEKPIVWSYVSFHWDKGIRFPVNACRTLHDEGIVPLIGIMPWSTLKQSKPEPEYTLDRILNGKYDDEIRQCAEDVKSLGFPIMMEFGPEVNGSWFPWNGAWNGRDLDVYGESGYPDGPERFKDAFIHIVGLFREAGADDVTWVFHVASDSSPRETWNSARYYYPGDEWVDWIGVSVYGRLKEKKPLKPFDEIMRGVYPELTALSPSKPIAILELGVSEAPGQGGKADWIRGVKKSIDSERYPRIKAVAWWNKIYRPDRTRSTLEINSSAESLSAYKEFVSDLVSDTFWSE